MGRGTRAEEARALCPEIVLVHVETIGDGDAAHDDDVDAPDRLNRKVTLERYRKASAEIMAIMSRPEHAAPAAGAAAAGTDGRRQQGAALPIERASIDECYVDVTSVVDTECAAADGGAAVAARGEAASGVVCDVDGGSPLDRRLAVGADVCARLRRAVHDELGYTVSGGKGQWRIIPFVPFFSDPLSLSQKR